MKKHYQLSERATLDLDAVIDYSIESFGEKVMLGYFSSFEKCFQSLQDNPELGQGVDYLREGYRCLEHKSHLVFYRIEVKGVFIVRILHKSMDARRHL